MQEQDKKPEAGKISRRDFIQTVAASGAGLMLSQLAFAQTAATGTQAAATTGTLAKAPAFIKTLGDVINVGIIGVGAEGQVLLNACTYEGYKIPKISFKAVCDIWPYNRKRSAGLLRAKGHPNNQYEDYREMLDKEKDLHAVIVATPDWMHAEHSIACMEAGLNVYCEKEMSNSLEKAKQMVQARDKTGKLLQIGHQRRSNPRYQYAINNVIFKNRILGRVGQANAQWNRSKKASQDLEITNKSIELAPDILAKYGYKTMHDFLNWRWYKKYGGGPIVDLGSHQIDIFSWVFKNNPRSVIASGGADFYKNHEWFDTVMCIFEFDSPEGPARAFYQVLTSTGNGGFCETFLGEDGTLVISELPASTKLLREGTLDDDAWDKFRNAHIIDKKPQPQIIMPASATKVVHDVRESAPPEEWAMPVDLSKPAHQPHLENFFDAIRTGIPLNCPAEVGYETAVAVLAVNRAVETGQKIEFKPEDFKVS